MKANAPRDLPIPFQPDMVLAILEDRKTQTRRLGRHRYNAKLAHWRKVKPGDLLWVRESWRTLATLDKSPPREIEPGTVIEYPASGPQFDEGLSGKTRPGMFMPRWASRITLRVTAVRVQELQEISEADAIAEGIARVGDVAREPGWKHYPDGSPAGGWLDPRQSYRTLWDNINGDGSWARNPEVVAITFERVTP